MSDDKKNRGSSFAVKSVNGNLMFKFDLVFGSKLWKTVAGTNLHTKFLPLRIIQVFRKKICREKSRIRYNDGLIDTCTYERTNTEWRFSKLLNVGFHVSFLSMEYLWVVKRPSCQKHWHQMAQSTSYRLASTQEDHTSTICFSTALTLHLQEMRKQEKKSFFVFL